MIELPVPPHFDPGSVREVWRVPYQERAEQAEAWAARHGIRPASEDRPQLCRKAALYDGPPRPSPPEAPAFSTASEGHRTDVSTASEGHRTDVSTASEGHRTGPPAEPRIGLLAIDVQNTFCLPDFELFVAGHSGSGAVDDSRRLCEFVYRNLGRLTRIVATLDTHTSMQISHPQFLVDSAGKHPAPMTVIRLDEVQRGDWHVNPALADSLGREPESLDAHLAHYCRELMLGGKYELIVWPYHAMLGGIGHALVSAVEEAFFFHAMARSSPTWFETKGRDAMSETYSVLRPELLVDIDGKPIEGPNSGLLDLLLGFDVLIIAGQAKSHCVAWTVADLLMEIEARDPALAKKVYLLEDCMSPVVVPGVVDYSGAADEAFARFEAAGMHRVRSTDPIGAWVRG